MAASAKRFVEMGISPALAVELAKQINAGVGNARRLLELGMLPGEAKRVAGLINGTAISANRLAETSLIPRVVREVISAVGGGTAPTLGTLTLSGALTNGTASSGAIIGATAGSTIVSNVTGLTINSVLRTYAWDGTGSAGTTSNGLVETLAGAIGSPKSNAVTVASAAATVPAAPTITATPGNAQNSIAWTDGSNGGAAITAHKLYRSTTSGAETLIGTIMTGSPYLDTGLTNGTAYFYKLSAVNSVGEGALSSEVSATPAASGGYSPDVASPFFANDIATLGQDVTTGYNAFYDATSNSTYVAHEAFNGSLTSRPARAQRYDHASDTWSPIYDALLSGIVGDDSHGTPALEIDQNGYIHIFGGAHNQPMQHAHSTNPRDVTAWTPDTQISPTSDSQNYGFSYPHPTLIGSKMYLGLRKAGQAGVNNSTSMPYVFVAGTVGAGGAITWAPDRTVIDLGSDSRCYSGQHTLFNGKIYWVMTRANSADTQRQDVYGFVYDPAADTISNWTGSVVTPASSYPIGRTLADASYKIIDQSASGTFGTIPHLCRDTGGLWHIIYSDAATATTDLQTVNVKHCYAALGSAFSTPTTIAVQKMRNDRFCIVANPTTGGVDAFVTVAPANTSIPWGNANGMPGGDMAKVSRTAGAGGTWGSPTTVLSAGYQAPYDSPVPVRNGLSAYYATIGEFTHDIEDGTGGQTNTVLVPAGGMLRNYAFSTTAKKTCTKPYQTTVMANYMGRRTTAPSATQTAYIDELLARMGNLGYTAKLDALYLLAMDNATDALLNILKSSFNATAVGGLTFTANSGFKGDGTTGYLNTNFAPATAGGVYAQNLAMIGAFTPTEGQEAKQLVGTLTTSGAPNVLITPRDATNKINVRLNDTSTQGNATFQTVASAVGHIVAGRSGATTESVARNGAVIGSGVTATSGLTSAAITLLKNDTNFSAKTISYFFIGGGAITANDLIFLCSIMNRYTGSQGITNA